MLLLAFDTAGPDCAAILARGGDEGFSVLARRTETLGRGHAERLISLLDEVLADAGLLYADLDRVAVATGPGSFTGVRVGVAAARGLALALGKPAFGVGTLQALIRPVGTAPTGTAVALLDARRGEVYALALDLASGALILGPTATGIDRLANALAGARRPLRLIGGGAPLLAAVLDPPACHIVAAGESPDIADVAALAFELPDEAPPPLPFYARGADAKPQGAAALARLEPA